MSEDRPGRESPGELGTARRAWTLGDYPAVARRLLHVSVELVDAVEAVAGPLRGRDVLDVGVGDGNAAAVAARRGARVVGVDPTPAQLDLARRRCAAEGLDVDLRDGDAQDLDLPDASFDVVVSVFAAIFAPDADRTAGELARVCRPGGLVALAAWADGGWPRAWRRRAVEVNPLPPGQDPGQWGHPAVARARLGAVGLEASTEERGHWWEFASVDEGVEFLFSSSGTFVAFREAAAARGRDADAVAAVRGALEECNEATDGTVRAPAPWLLVLGRRP